MDTTLFTTLAVIGLTVLIGGAVAVRLLLPKLITWNELRKMLEEEKVELATKAELLENEQVIELLSPSARFRVPVDRESGKKPRHQQAWLSPYPSAVKAANKRHKRELKKGNEVTMTRSQIADAASRVKVEVLSDAEQPANAGTDHFSITFQLQGLTEQKIRGLAPELKAQLGLHSIEEANAPDYRSVRFIAHASKPQDKMSTLTPGRDFFDQYPADRVTSIPLAMKTDGTPWCLPTHHTLIHGTTGSGKGSPIQGIIAQLEPFIKQGVVKLYGIDPKNAELKPYRVTSLFESLALGENQAMLDEIVSCWAVMKKVQDEVVPTVENDFGRSVPFTRETPLRLVVVDELFSFLSALKTMGKDGAKATQKFAEIVAQGRSGNMFVIAATQAASKELMGDMRDNFPNKIVLRLEDGNEYWNKLWLGDSSIEKGFNAMAITKAGPDNNYATAGVAYVKEETGDPVKVRFARTTRDDLNAILRRNPKVTSSTSTEEPPSTEAAWSKCCYTSENSRPLKQTGVLSEIGPAASPPAEVTHGAVYKWVVSSRAGQVGTQTSSVVSSRGSAKPVMVPAHDHTQAVRDHRFADDPWPLRNLRGFYAFLA